jgi:hypothetical protein
MDPARVSAALAPVSAQTLPASTASYSSLSSFSLALGVDLGLSVSGHTSEVVGSALYVLGGTYSHQSDNFAVDNVQRGTIVSDGSLQSDKHNPDGSFSAFTTTNSLVDQRTDHTSVVLGHSIYVIGGAGDVGENAVQRATINEDGTLSPFAILPGVKLHIPRYGHTHVVAGNSLYIIGGASDFVWDDVSGPYVKWVERATFSADGTLSNFSIVPNVTLATPRANHTTVAVGNSIYVIGGAGANGATGSVERATINPDGTLSTFAAVPAEWLAVARSNHTATVVGSSLYVIGGADGDHALDSVERATINPDGTLSTFATVAGVKLAEPRLGHSSVVSGNLLYVIGGYNDGGLGQSLSDVEVATLQ